MARPAANKVETIRKQLMYLLDSELEQIEQAVEIIREVREAQAELAAMATETAK